MSQFFKVSNFDSIPVRTSVKSILSPPRKVQTGRVNDIGKLNQRSKMSFRPRPTFINPIIRRSRNNLANTKKELMKKMIYIAECALKEKGEIKHSTPVKMPIGIMTPCRTPRPSGYYFTVPDLNKNTPKTKDLRTPMHDIIKRPLFVNSMQETPNLLKKKKESTKKVVESKLNCSFDCNKDLLSEFSNIPNNEMTFTSILNHCQSYNTKASDVYEKIQKLDECFEKNIQNLPHYKIYHEFCLYQARKEELYNNIKFLEEELNNAVKGKDSIGYKLKVYITKRQEIFDKRLKLHKEFEEIVMSALKKCQDLNKNERNVKEKNINLGEPKPKLRRSLRLSRIPRKIEEKTPLSKRLQNLDMKSKRIQKGGNVKSLRLKRF